MPVPSSFQCSIPPVPALGQSRGDSERLQEQQGPTSHSCFPPLTSILHTPSFFAPTYHSLYYLLLLPILHPLITIAHPQSIPVLAVTSDPLYCI